MVGQAAGCPPGGAWHPLSLTPPDPAVNSDRVPVSPPIIPKFQSHAPGAQPSTAWSLGSLLAAINAPAPATPGTVAATSGGLVTGTGTTFTTQLAVGDFIQLGAGWYQVESVTNDTQLTVDAPQGGLPASDVAPAGSPLVVRNWTKVPELAASGSDPGFHYRRGTPDATGLTFPQQFAELHDALGQLTQTVDRYDTRLFGADESQEFVAVGVKLANAYEAVFGPGPVAPNASSPLRALKALLGSGGADPGARFTSADLGLLRQMVDALAAVVYVRDPNASSNNGWASDPGNAAVHPITFMNAGERAVLLPALPDGSRQAGQWSSHAAPGDPILPQHLQEVSDFLDAMVSNGLWLSKGPATVPSAPYQDDAHFAHAWTDPSDPPPTWPTVPDAMDIAGWAAAAPPGELSGFTGTATLGMSDQVGSLDYGWASPTTGSLDYAAMTVQATLPTAANPLGGANVTTMALGPTGGAYNSSAWAWGQALTLASIGASDVHQALLDHFPVVTPLPTSQAGLQTVTAGGPVDGSFGFDWSTVTRYDVEDDHSLDTQGDWAQHATVRLDLPPVVLYGAVPQAGGFSYTPGPAPTDVTPAAVPSDPLPLTTELDYRNAVPDAPQDDIVQVSQDQQSLGPDSGSIAFQADRDVAQVYLPIYTDVSGALPVHAYLVQGGFGSSPTSVGSLRSPAFKFPDADENGLPYAYSLDTRVRVNLLLNDASNHVKRIEVVRPRGNAVVFDFPWDPSTNDFSPVGAPAGAGGRDSRQLYVLRAVDGGGYELRFPSGVTHVFSSPAFGGYLTAVRDADGLTANVAAGLTGSASIFGNTIDTGTPPTLTAWDRYDVSLHFSAGHIDTASYATKGSNPETFTTTLGYAAGSSADVPAVQSLSKSASGPAASGAVPDFSYQLAGPGVIQNNGSETDRSGTVASGSVTITNTLPGVSGSAAETWQFNSDRLVTSDANTLTEPDGSSSSAATSYQYASGGRLAVNGAAVWGEVTQVTYPDDSWETYTYAPDTGWVATDTTPFKNGQSGSGPGGSVVTSYTYADPTGTLDASGTGDVADTTQLTERPRQVTTTTAGTVTDVVYNQYHGTTFVTRHALALSGASGQTTDFSAAAWKAAGLETTTTLGGGGAGSYTLKTPTGKQSVISSRSGNSTTYTSTGSFFGKTTSSDTQTLDAFGTATSSLSKAVGATPAGISGTPSTDALGRLLSETDIGGTTSGDSNYSWAGPQTVTGPDGSTTTYAYTPWGAVQTMTAANPSGGSVTTSYGYDAAGNVVSTTTTGGGQTVTATAAFDAQGRQTSSTDEMGRKTTTTYTSTAQGTTVASTTTAAPTPTPSPTSGPTSTTETDTYYLDGSQASVGGSAVTPESFDEGVDPATGDTWAQTLSSNGNDWDKSFTNLAGEGYKEQQSDASAPGGFATALAGFDGNGREVASTGFDGSTSHTVYDPATGEPKRQWQDNNGDGSFEPGSDDETVTTFVSGVSDPNALPSDPATPAGEKEVGLTSEGQSTTVSTESQGGLVSSQTVDGKTTTDSTSFDGGGEETDTTVGPDGTRTIDTVTDGVVTEEKQLGADGSTITDATYGTDALGRTTTETDKAADGTPLTTTDTLNPDGSVASTSYPDGRSTSQTPDALGDGVSSFTDADGKVLSQSFDAQGRLAGQSGDGTVASGYGYDPATGDVSEIDTFTSGTVGGSGKSATRFAYDPATGMLASKTFNDGSKDTFQYNGKLQLAGETLPGVTANFTYDAAGDQSGSTYTDSTGGSVSDAVVSRDDAGRPLVTKETTGGGSAPSTTTTAADTYTAEGQLASDTAGPSGATIAYDYEQAGDPAPGAVKDVKLLSGGTTLSETDYGYDPATKQLQTITVKGQGTTPAQSFTLAYQPNTDLLQTVTGPASTTTLGYDPHNQRLSSIGAVTTANGTIYNAAYAYYDNDQRHTETVTRSNSAGPADTYTATYSYDPQNQLSAITAAGSGGPAAGAWTYDGVGNRLTVGGTPFAGGVSTNGLNQYNNFHYNARGDCTDDGTFTFGWDATDRLTSVTARDDSARVTFGYDAEGRLAERDAYAPGAGGAWTLSAVTRYAWDGQNLLAEFDGSNRLLRTFGWGPTGLLSVTDYTSGTAKTYTAVKDATGSVVQLVDSSGAVVADYHYDAWGTCAASGPAASACPFRFAGMYRDEATGLYYDQVRFYSATQGRFLSRDPSGEDGGLNLYAYCQNDPVNKVDPTGTQPAPPPEVPPEEGRDERDEEEEGEPLYGDALLRDGWIRMQQDREAREAAEAAEREFADFMRNLRLQHGLSSAAEEMLKAAQEDAQMRLVELQTEAAAAIKTHASDAEIQQIGAEIGRLNRQLPIIWRARAEVEKDIVAHGGTPSRTAEAPGVRPIGAPDAEPTNPLVYGPPTPPELLGQEALSGGSAASEAYIRALRESGPENYEFIRAASPQYTPRSCVIGALRQRFGMSTSLTRMEGLAETQGGYTLQQARSYVVNHGIAREESTRYVDSISVEALAARAAQAKGTATTFLNVRGTSGPHCVGVQGWQAVEGAKGGRFQIHDPLTGTEYWESAEHLRGRITPTPAEANGKPPVKLGDALLID